MPKESKPWLKGIFDFQPGNEPTITWIYPRRFRKGKCFIVATLPARGLTLDLFAHIEELYKGLPYPPRIMNYREEICVRLLFPCPGLKSGNEKGLAAFAKRFSQWAIPFFDMRMVIVPIEDDIALLKQFLEP